MTTFVGTQEDFVEALQCLVQLDYASIEEYQAAISRLEKEEYKAKIIEFKQDREQHIKEFSDIIKHHNKRVPEDSGAKKLFTEGRVKISSLSGDKPILMALKLNEDDTNIAYERLNEHPYKTDESIEPLQRTLQDERRHRDWLQRTILTL